VAGAMMLAWVPAAPVSAAQSHQPAAHAPHSIPGQSAPRALNTALPPNAVLRREVLGFFNYGAMGDPSVGYTTWQFKLLSTVVYFRLQVNSGNGYIVPSPDPGWVNFHSTLLTNLINYAHSYGTRVIVSINLHDFSTSPSNQVCTGLIKANYMNTITESLQLVQQMGMDGVNLNYEATNTNCSPTSDPTDPVTSRDRLTNFVAALRQAMPSPAYLAIDTFSGSAEDNLEFFNVTGIAPNVDSMFVMAYDMDYANSTEAPILCSSYCFNPMSPLNTYRFNVTKSMQQYTALVPASKVILGQPYYGRRGCVAGPSPALQYPIPGTNFATPTYLYASTIPSQSGVSQFTAHRDGGDGVSEWDTWWDTDWGCWREQYFDDVVSLGAKYDVVNNMNLRGVGLFTLDYGGGATELWNLLDLKFGTPTPWTQVGGFITSTPDPASWGANRTDIFVRGQEGGVWDASWNGTSWSWTFLGGLIQGNPAAVSWGSGRFDVFVRGIDNALWHRSSDGTTWAAWEKLGGVIATSPDVSSWGPNRLDVFVTGQEQALWQATWNGTAWSWNKLGGVITSDPTAVASTTNRIDVFVRGTERGLWQASWNGSAWTWTFLGGILTSNPEPASCTAGHLDVFLSGTEHGLWRRGFNGTIWGPWEFQRGQWTASPGATCIPGTSTVAVFERAGDGSVWQTSIPAS
jgi:spore germination protein YaaH